jgi:hypothetical protein
VAVHSRLTSYISHLQLWHEGTGASADPLVCEAEPLYFFFAAFFLVAFFATFFFLAAIVLSPEKE